MPIHLPRVDGESWVDVNSLFSYYNEVYFGRKLGGGRVTLGWIDRESDDLDFRYCQCHKVPSWWHGPQRGSARGVRRLPLRRPPAPRALPRRGPRHRALLIRRRALDGVKQRTDYLRRRTLERINYSRPRRRIANRYPPTASRSVLTTPDSARTGASCADAGACPCAGQCKRRRRQESDAARRSAGPQAPEHT